MRFLFIQLCAVIMATTAWCQQFNSSPIRSLTQQHVLSPHGTRTGENQRQQFRFVTAPIPQNQVSSRLVQEIFQQPAQSQVHVRTFPLTTVGNTIVPFQQVSSHRQTLQPSKQTFHTVSFSTSQQGFQPSSFSSPQQQIPAPTQQTQRHAVQARDPTFPTTSQRSVQITATPVPQRVHQAQQANIPLHQQQLTRGTARTPPAPVQTFATQQFSAQTQPLTQQQNNRKATFSQTQNPQQGTLHKTQSTQLEQQQQQMSQKTVVQNQQTTDVTTLSPEEELFQKQARDAKYSFDSAIKDNIMDSTQVRQEKRNGLELSGLYSYSDGFYKRTVHYKADEHGYRVTKEKIEPIGSGPQVNPDGDAVVSTNIAGVKNMYSITAADIRQLQESEEDTEI